MNYVAATGAYGVLTDRETLRIQRLLPGPIERVWDYLMQSELRRKWFAAGDMDMKVGAPLELIWRNDELTCPPGERPEGISAENRMQSRVLELEPLRKLAITWGSESSVSFELEQQNSEVLLTIIHRKVPDRSSLLKFAPGWHAHLDVLASILANTVAQPFWDQVRRPKGEYAERLPN